MGKQRRGTRGKLYTIKTPAFCKQEGIPCTPLPKGVTGHMVIALSQPDHHGMVKFATITSNSQENVQFYPIAPTARQPYPFQLHIRDYNNQYRGHPSALFKYSYLRAEIHMVPAAMLVELPGDYGDHLMLKNESVDKLASALRTNLTVG